VSRLTDLSDEFDLDAQMLDLLALVLQDDRTDDIVCIRQEVERFDLIVLILPEHLLELILIAEGDLDVEWRAAEAEPILPHTTREHGQQIRTAHDAR
jgi:hypothetical protein